MVLTAPLISAVKSVKQNVDKSFAICHILLTERNSIVSWVCEKWNYKLWIFRFMEFFFKTCQHPVKFKSNPPRTLIIRWMKRYLHVNTSALCSVNTVHCLFWFTHYWPHTSIDLHLVCQTLANEMWMWSDAALCFVHRIPFVVTQLRHIARIEYSLRIRSVN